MRKWIEMLLNIETKKDLLKINQRFMIGIMII